MIGIVQGTAIVVFYALVPVALLVGLALGIVGAKQKIAAKRGAAHTAAAGRYCLCGIASAALIMLIAFFPAHTIFSAKYAQEDSLLRFFEEHFEQFEEKSFEGNWDLSFGNDVRACIRGKRRTRGEKCESMMTFELEYRSGTLLEPYPNTQFKNIIVYSERDIAADNPRPNLFKEINRTSRENWYFVRVSDAYEYF